MTDDPYFRPQLLTRAQDSYLHAVGRAMMVAQHFEQSCRGFLTLLDFKKAVFSGEATPEEPASSDFVSDLQKRMLHEITRQFVIHWQMPAEFAHVLSEAREARNYIAHEAAIACECHPLEDPDERIVLCTFELARHTHRIARADQFVSGWIYQQNEKEVSLPTAKYVREVLEWVFAEFDRSFYQFSDERI